MCHDQQARLRPEMRKPKERRRETIKEWSMRCDDLVKRRDSMRWR